MAEIDNAVIDEALTSLYAYQEELEVSRCGDFTGALCEARGCGGRCELDQMKIRVHRTIIGIEESIDS